jgi:hypothetical protein
MKIFNLKIAARTFGVFVALDTALLMLLLLIPSHGTTLLWWIFNFPGYWPAIFVGLLGLVVSLSGCASAIYGSGKGKDVFQRGTDRATVIACFGEPVGHGTDKCGRSYEIYRAEGKIAPPHDDVVEFQEFEAVTYGIGDIFWTPAQLVAWPFKTMGKKDIDVYFDQNGKYLYHTTHRANSDSRPNTALEPTPTAP